MQRSLCHGLLAVAPVVGVLACAPALESNEPPDAPGRLTIGFAGDQAGIREVVSVLTTEGLVQTNPDGSYRPLLATSWHTTAHENGTRTVTFALKEGVSFHDGTPFEAAVVKRFLDDARTSAFLPASYPSLADIEEVSVLGSSQVGITLRETSGFLLDALTLGIFLRDPAGRRAGTGPFVVTNRSDAVVTLAANPAYHQGRPSMETVQLADYPSLRTAWAAMMRGEVDVLHEVPIAARDFVDEETEVNLVRVVRPYAFLLGFNRERATFEDVRVRQALNHAVDRQAIVDLALEGEGRPTSGLWGFHRSYRGVERTYRYDPLRADRLLEEAGFPRPEPSDRTAEAPDTRLEFVCLVPTSIPLAERIALVLQRQLSEIGVSMALVPFEGRDPGELRESGVAWDALLVLQPTGQSLSRLYSLWYSSAMLNPFGYASADDILRRLRRTEPGAEQDQAAREFQRLIYDDPPAAFLVEWDQARAISTRFRVPTVAPGRDVIATLREWEIRSP